jgi:hypothetical protein
MGHNLAINTGFDPTLLFVRRGTSRAAAVAEGCGAGMGEMARPENASSTSGDAHLFREPALFLPPLAAAQARRGRLLLRRLAGSFGKNCTLLRNRSR